MFLYFSRLLHNVHCYTIECRRLVYIALVNCRKEMLLFFIITSVLSSADEECPNEPLYTSEMTDRPGISGAIVCLRMDESHSGLIPGESKPVDLVDHSFVGQ